jgi:hypothetical protein
VGACALITRDRSLGCAWILAFGRLTADILAMIALILEYFLWKIYSGGEIYLNEVSVRRR